MINGWVSFSISCDTVMQGKYFYLTPGICPSLSTMKSILESAGGKLLTKQPSYRKIMEHNQNKVLNVAATLSCLCALINVPFIPYHRGGRFLCDNMAEIAFIFMYFHFQVQNKRNRHLYIWQKSFITFFLYKLVTTCWHLVAEPSGDHINFLWQWPSPL